ADVDRHGESLRRSLATPPKEVATLRRRLRRRWRPCRLCRRGRSALAGAPCRRIALEFPRPMPTLKEPQFDEVLAFCAEDPVERVFLEDVARRGLGRFTAVERRGSLEALCHTGSNVVPSGKGCAAFADVVLS